MVKYVFIRAEAQEDYRMNTLKKRGIIIGSGLAMASVTYLGMEAIYSHSDKATQNQDRVTKCANEIAALSVDHAAVKENCDTSKFEAATSTSPNGRHEVTYTYPSAAEYTDSYMPKAVIADAQEVTADHVFGGMAIGFAGILGLSFGALITMPGARAERRNPDPATNQFTTSI